MTTSNIYDEQLCSKDINYCCKALNLRCLPGSWVHLYVFQQNVKGCKRLYKVLRFPKNLASLET